MTRAWVHAVIVPTMRSIIFLAALATFASASTAQGRTRIVAVCGYNLCQIDPSSGKATKLTRDGTRAKSYDTPSLSRSGSRLAFTRDSDLYVGDRTGRRARRIEKGFVRVARIAPDGKGVVFVEGVFGLLDAGPPAEYGFERVLYQRALNGAKARSLASDISSTAYLGSRVVHELHSSLSGKPDSICLDPADPKTLDKCERTVASDPVRALSRPAASPDGRRLVAVAEPFTTAAGYRQVFKGVIALFDPSSGRLMRNLTRGSADTDPAVSPDGRQVVFSRGKDLYTVRLDGRASRATLLRKGMRNATWGG